MARAHSAAMFQASTAIRTVLDNADGSLSAQCYNAVGLHSFLQPQSFLTAGLRRGTADAWRCSGAFTAYLARRPVPSRGLPADGHAMTSATTTMARMVATSGRTLRKAPRPHRCRCAACATLIDCCKVHGQSWMSRRRSSNQSGRIALQVVCGADVVVSPVWMTVLVSYKTKPSTITVRRQMACLSTSGARRPTRKGLGQCVAVPRGSTACPVATLKGWIEAAGITEGAVFRRVFNRKAQRVTDQRLHGRAIASIVKKGAARLGFDVQAFGRTV
jgi:hypothetical protein